MPAHPGPAGNDRLTVVLAHGAGGHKDHPHLRDLARALGTAGFAVHRFDFAYRAEGRRFPDRMPALVARFRREAERVRGGLILAGHSLGSRAALALAAEGFPCVGLMLFSYPLHPPGHREKLRLDHLREANAPVLSISGTRDAFCTPPLMARALRGIPHWTHYAIEGADHGLRVTKASGRTRAAVLEEVAVACRAWAATLPRARTRRLPAVDNQKNKQKADKKGPK